MENVDLKATPMSYGPPTFKHNPHRLDFLDIAEELHITKYLSILLKKIPRFKRFLKKFIDR